MRPESRSPEDVFGSDFFGKVAARGLVLSVLGSMPTASDARWIPALQLPSVAPLGAVLGGIGGYFLGQLGSLGAKVGIVILDVLAVPLLGFDSIIGLAPAIAAGG